MSTYPSDSECISILQEAGCKRRVIVHCCTVWTMAEAFANRIDCDIDLLRAGAFLHDLGRSVDHSIMHAVIGASMAIDMGLPMEVVEIIRRHIGAGLDSEEVKELGLPAGDYIPKTIEQKIVCHADNMVSDNKFVTHTYSVERLAHKGSMRGSKRIADLHKELSALYGSDLYELVNRIGPYPSMKGACAQFTVPPEARL